MTDKSSIECPTLPGVGFIHINMLDLCLGGELILKQLVPLGLTFKPHPLRPELFLLIVLPHNRSKAPAIGSGVKNMLA